MPVPEDCIRVHLNFDMNGGEEIAVATFALQQDHIEGAGSNWEEVTQRAAEKVSAKWKERMPVGVVTPWFASTVRLSNVTTYHLEAATGHTLHKGVAVEATPWKGTGGPSLPFECSAAVSLYAYTPGSFVANRGRKRGRMYLPPLTTGAMAPDMQGVRPGVLAPGAVGPLADGLGAFFNDVNQMTVGEDPLGIGSVWTLGVISRADVAFYPVTHIRLGNVLDTQRRRRNKQNEVYTDRVITND